MSEVSRILSAIESGNPRAAGELLPLVYDELRRLAAAKLAQEKPGQTLQATALVHEAYVRLIGEQDLPHWDSRGHFFAAAAEAMRRILVDSARRKARLKHGGQWRQNTLDLDALSAPAHDEDVLALHEALSRLASQDPIKARLVELRFFAGLTLSEAAQCLNISPSTADRAWRYARVWLYEAMDSSQDSSYEPSADGA
jgi:RNA polymerase sigma factor (TIGR02999 family)